MKHRFWFSFLLAAGLASCSGGGGGGPGGAAAPRPARLLVDTTNASAAFLAGTLEVVTLEDATGNLTENLLEAPARLDLFHPLGRPSGIRLARIPSGVFVALRLLVQGGSLRSRRDDGSEEPVEVARNDLRVAFEDAVAGGPPWLLLRNRGPSSLARKNGKLVWQPSLSARRAGPHLLPQTTVHVLATDLARGRAFARMDDVAGMSIFLVIPDDAVLTSLRGPGRRSRDDFLRGLSRGSRIRCKGLLDDSGGLRISWGDDRGRDDSSTGESKVLARITFLDPKSETLRAQVLSIRRGASNLARDPLPEITLLAKGARIHRSGSRDRVLAFSDLRSGALVEVEWRGDQDPSSIRAREIEIEDDAGRRIGPETEGRVAEVRVAEHLLIVVPRKDDPLIVGGKTVARATVEVSAATVLLRRNERTRTPIELAQVTTRDRISVRGTVVGPGRIAADVIRVRDDSRSR